MRYLLDTNVWIKHLKSEPRIESRLRRTPASEIAVCSVVWAELLHGARKYGNRAARETRVRTALAPFVSLPFDNRAAIFYAEIRHDLEVRGSLIGPNDLLIASIARSNGLVLVTSDEGFARVPSLQVERWIE